MRRIVKQSLMATLLVSYAISSLAADFNYNYGQVSYDDAEFDFGPGAGILNTDADGFSLAGSFEVTPELFVTASISMWEAANTVDADTWLVGAGYHMPLNAKTDLLVEANIGNLEMSAVTSLDYDIWAVSAGVRHSLDDKLEIGGKFGWKDYERKPDTDTFFQVNAVYEFQKNIAGLISYETADTIDVLSVAARFYF